MSGKIEAQPKWILKDMDSGHRVGTKIYESSNQAEGDIESLKLTENKETGKNANIKAVQLLNG